MRRLPGPAHYRPGDGGDSRGSLRFVSGLAANTNSIFCDGSNQPETANGCPVLQRSRNHQPRGTHAQPTVLTISSALSRARTGISRFSLDISTSWKPVMHSELADRLMAAQLFEPDSDSSDWNSSRASHLVADPRMHLIRVWDAALRGHLSELRFSHFFRSSGLQRFPSSSLHASSSC